MREDRRRVVNRELEEDVAEALHAVIAAGDKIRDLRQSVRTRRARKHLIRAVIALAPELNNRRTS
jgi:hypothetical protein